MKTNNSKEGGERFVFREVRNIDELDELFRLRYRVYRQCNLKKFVPENQYQIDIDSYDLRSRHFGLFAENGDKTTAIGCMRVAEDQSNPAGFDITKLRQKYPNLAEIFDSEARYPFPLMEYVPNVESLLDIYAGAKSRSERFCEAGRFALEDNHRYLRLAKHMVECAFAVYFFHYGFEHAIWCCDARSGAFYKKYGLTAVDGIPEDDYLDVGEKSVCLIGSPWSMPAKARDRISRMAVCYAASGTIPLNYEKNNIVDLTRPLAAVRVMS